MTATPHNGKEEDFQLFLALLDPDRFEGRFREGVHQVDISDMMRRMVKEDLRPLRRPPALPRAPGLHRQLSALARREGSSTTRSPTTCATSSTGPTSSSTTSGEGTVGFALTILQRRLASSPEAIYQSLRRRRERLEKRLAEVKAGQRQPQTSPSDEIALLRRGRPGRPGRRPGRGGGGHRRSRSWTAPPPR